MVLQNRRNRFGKTSDGKVWLLSQRFAVIAIDKDRAATGGVRAIDVAPAIADQKAAGEIDAVSLRRAQQHAGLRFSAIARIAMTCPGMKTNFDSVQRGHSRAQRGVHRFDRLTILRSATNVRLVRHDDQKKPGLFKLPAVFSDVGIKLELAKVRGRKRKPVADHRAVENAVAIEKDGAPVYLVLSHFVCAVFSAG